MTRDSSTGSEHQNVDLKIGVQPPVSGLQLPGLSMARDECDYFTPRMDADRDREG